MVVDPKRPTFFVRRFQRLITCLKIILFLCLPTVLQKNKKCSSVVLSVFSNKYWGLQSRGELKGRVPRDFWLQVFFHESVSPKPLSIQLRPFWFFFKNLWRHLQLKVHHRCSWHRWQREKFQQSEFFLLFYLDTFG